MRNEVHRKIFLYLVCRQQTTTYRYIYTGNHTQLPEKKTQRPRSTDKEALQAALWFSKKIKMS